MFEGLSVISRPLTVRSPWNGTNECRDNRLRKQTTTLAVAVIIAFALGCGGSSRSVPKGMLAIGKGPMFRH